MSAITEARFIDRMFAQLAAGGTIPELIRADEIDAGHRIVMPGEEPWFSADEWSADSVVSIDRRRVRLILLVATRPGTGAFTRLTAHILAGGLKPVVLAPTREFQELLSRRGWRRKDFGTGFRREERWEPVSLAGREGRA